ncbi:MAG: leucine-rich repeat protein [Bacilli bacterium]|nr:leucine-rich repeat protein [Bacilli bacterium]
MNEYYIISNNKVIGINSSFKKYLSNNNDNAPDIPKGVIEIDENTFKDIENINEIFIPDTLKDLSIKVFEKYDSIKINYNNIYLITIRKKDVYARYNKVYKLSGYFNDLNIYLDNNKGTLYEIPKWISCIGEFSFKENLKIKRVILNNKIAIFKEAFCDCHNLKEIINSNYIVDYGDDAFRNCIKLKEIDIPIDVLNIRSNVFLGCRNLKINLFNKDILTAKEFIIKQRNLFMNDRKDSFKVLKTRDYYYFINNDIVDKKSKKEFTYSNVINKHLGYIYKNKTYFEDNLETTYKIYLNTGIVPYDFISKNIKNTYIDNYLKYEKEFDKVILNKVRTISKKVSLNNKNEQVGRLTISQYETLLKLCIISGFFEHEEGIRKKSINLINNYLLPIDSTKGLNLSLNKLDNLFKNINSQNVTYNQEFSTYFLFNKDNLIKLIKKLSKSHQSFINTLLIKCGDSDIKYKHDDKYEDSLGLLHDEWIVYRNNNNDKQKNINNNNKSTVLSFIDWSLTLDEQTNYNNLKIDNKIIDLFSKYYNNEKALIKLDDVISNSNDICPYIFIPDKYLDKEYKNFNIANIHANDVFKKLEISKVKNINDINEIIKKEEELLSVEKDNFKAIILEKNSYIAAYSSCVMGNCANVTSTGCEYLYESYYDNSTQPFIIYNDKEPIANFRIDIDKKTGNASINSLEVISNVKFKYSNEDKNNIVYVFDKIINNFIEIYNKYNDINIKKISMGKLSNFDINDILEKHYKSTQDSFYIKKRIVCTPSTKNHFIVYNKEN